MEGRAVRRDHVRVAGVCSLLLGAALAPMGCQVTPHGQRAPLREAKLEPLAGDARTLERALEESHRIGAAGSPVASAGGR